MTRRNSDCNTILRSHHGIQLTDVSPNAIFAVQCLQKSGFEAYIVGGAVRDLLINLKPKDFDIATNATPQEILKVFQKQKKSAEEKKARRLTHKPRIIGRRFTIVHVYFWSEILEVTTFRGNDPNDQDADTADTDNTFFVGNRNDDALRRDFTANALLYDPVKETVIDHVGGFEDTQNRQLRTIGDPCTRYQEDPVRMLRAVRLSSKLQMEIEAKSEKPIRSNRKLLANVAIRRIFDEIIKILSSGAAAPTFQKLNQLGLLQEIMPHIENLNAKQYDFIDMALTISDHRFRQEKRNSISFAIAAIYWPTVVEKWQEKISQKASLSDFEQTIESSEIHKNPMITKRVRAKVMQIWRLQTRFHVISRRKSIYRTLNMEGFRQSLAFLRMRVEAGEASQDILDNWISLYENNPPADQDENTDNKDLDTTALHNKKGRNRRRAKKKATVQPTQAEE